MEMKVGPGVGAPGVEGAEPEDDSSKGAGHTTGQNAGAESPYAQTFAGLKDEFAALGHASHESATGSSGNNHQVVHGGELQRPSRVSTK
jgi:hypothetical protein